MKGLLFSIPIFSNTAMVKKKKKPKKRKTKKKKTTKKRKTKVIKKKTRRWILVKGVREYTKI